MFDMTMLTRWVLAHRRLVVGFWVLVTVVGMASAGSATGAIKQKFSVPGKEGWETNQQITRLFHGTGGNSAPLVPVVVLPAGKTATDPGVRRALAAVEGRLRRALPGARVAGFPDTGSRAFVSKDGRTVFSVAYPPPDPDQPFNDNPKAEKKARAALRGATVAGAPVHLSGFDALADASGGGDGPGVLVEALFGGFGALLVLAFVFGSFLALVPIAMAVVSIMTTFLVIWGLTSVTDVSPIVQFLVALIGLGVAIDYALIVVVRWREEIAHGLEGDAAILRAMETAGRAVVFSGTTVGVGLLALVALPLPFLRSVGYGGLLIPVISVIVAITLLPVILHNWGQKLDWPHRRTDDQASAFWTRWAQGVVRHRLIAALSAGAVLVALLFAASNIQLGLSNPDTIAKHGEAKQGLVALEKAGIGAGALNPHEVLVRGADPEQVAARLARVEDINGTVAPRGWRAGDAASVL